MTSETAGESVQDPFNPHATLGADGLWHERLEGGRVRFSVAFPSWQLEDGSDQ